MTGLLVYPQVREFFWACDTAVDITWLVILRASLACRCALVAPLRISRAIRSEAVCGRASVNAGLVISVNLRVQEYGRSLDHGEARCAVATIVNETFATRILAIHRWEQPSV